MQTTGYLLIDGEKIKVLVRQAKYCRYLKLRKSGKDGWLFGDESIYLADEPKKVKRLKDGETITC